MIVMESDTVLVQYIITQWSLDYKNSSKFTNLCLLCISDWLSRWSWQWCQCSHCDAEKNHQWALDNISPNFLHSLNSLCYKFLQTILFWGHSNSQPDISAGADHSVHQCLPVSATHCLCEADWCLAHIFSTNSICRGFKLTLIFYVSKIAVSGDVAYIHGQPERWCRKVNQPPWKRD